MMAGFGFVGWGRAHVLGVRACAGGGRHRPGERVGAGARPGAATAVNWWEQASGGVLPGRFAAHRLLPSRFVFVFPLVSRSIAA